MDAQKFVEGRAADRELENPDFASQVPFRRRTFFRVLLAIPLLFVGSSALLVWSVRPRYPFGPSHCCDKALSFALRAYAETHDGWFPKGESSPEASLCLLYRADPNILYTLPGKSIPEATVRAILEGGGLLGPTTCGWHYVEGLRDDDDSRLGLFWDKEGLGHNGETLRDGGHTIFRVNGSHDYVRGKEWPAFLNEQAELHKQLKREPETKSEVVE